MINLNEMIKLKWTTRNKAYYQGKGYSFTHLGDELWVYLKDLPKDSHERVPVKCDCEECSSPDTITPYRNYNKIIRENGIYRCKSCTGKNNIAIRTIKTHKNLYDLFLQKCEERNCIPITTFDQFHGWDTNMEYECPLHGRTSTLMARISSEGAWCRECGFLKLSEKRSLTPEEVKKRIEEKNNNTLLNPDEYEGVEVRNLNVICGRCHKVFTTSLASIMNGSGMCPECGNYVSSHATKYSKEDVIKMATINDCVMVLNPDDYKNMSSRLKFVCSECGNEFETTPHNYLLRGFTRCECCSIFSQGEEDIKSVLEEFNIKYIPQMRFDDCRDQKKLPFDFYLPDYNYLIEFNGGQHYFPVCYFGGQERLEYTQKHDKMKADYAKRNGYNYLVITYENQKNIRDILISALKLE